MVSVKLLSCQKRDGPAGAPARPCSGGPAARWVAPGGGGSLPTHRHGGFWASQFGRSIREQQPGRRAVALGGLGRATPRILGPASLCRRAGAPPLRPGPARPGPGHCRPPSAVRRRAGRRAGPCCPDALPGPGLPRPPMRRAPGRSITFWTAAPCVEHSCCPCMEHSGCPCVEHIGCPCVEHSGCPCMEHGRVLCCLFETNWH